MNIDEKLVKEIAKVVIETGVVTVVSFGLKAIASKAFNKNVKDGLAKELEETAVELEELIGDENENLSKEGEKQNENHNNNRNVDKTKKN